MFKRIGLLACVLGLVSLASCGHFITPASSTSSEKNAPGGALQAHSNKSKADLAFSRIAQGLASSPVDPNSSFSNANGQQLTRADIDRYIDPDVTGNDRALAEQFMGMQQLYSRGDFVFVGQHGHIVSNRDVLREAYLAQPQYVRHGSNDLAYRRTMTYPPAQNSFQGGPFYREYTTLGITAAFAFVTVPCNDELFFSGDTGDVYFGQDGPSDGETEGGLQVTDSPPMVLEAPSIQLYGRSTNSTYSSSRGYTSIVNPVHYQCGQPLTIEYGQLPNPVNGQMYFFAMAGIPEYNPMQYSIPGDVISSTNVSYVYALTPTDFNWPGTDRTSTPTPCSQCYIRRMDSIAQAAYNPYSGECFGMCNGYIDIRWDQVYMGQMTQYVNTPLSGGGFTIATTMKVSGEPWFGGVQKFPDAYRVQSSTANLPVDSINWDYEGLNLAGSSPQQMQASGTFGSLQPVPTPAPTPVATKDPSLQFRCGWKNCW